MRIQVVKSKIHRVRVTGADLNYIGSITIDEALMEAANIFEGEKVSIVNINNGERLETYAITGPRNSGEITLNGPAARKVHKDDIIIIIAYGSIEMSEAKNFKPSIVFPNEEDLTFHTIYSVSFFLGCAALDFAYFMYSDGGASMHWLRYLLLRCSRFYFVVPLGVFTGRLVVLQNELDRARVKTE